jgi:putative DNA primase/helicase
MDSETDRARDALSFIPSDCSRDEWVRRGMAAKAAGLDFEDFHKWSAKAANYKNERDVAAVWKSIKTDGGVTAKTLFKTAAEHGYRLNRNTPKNRATLEPRRTEMPATPLKLSTARDVWGRCEVAPEDHAYILAKAGRPNGLRVVPHNDSLVIRGERMAGWLVVPVTNGAGELASLQFIAPPDVAKDLATRNVPGKLNLPGAPMAGTFIVGDLEAGATAYLAEGIGTAWACWKATGRASVVCFGWGMVKARAAELRTRDPAMTLVIVPDVGKDAEAEAIARGVGGKVAAMPEGWPKNSDVGDLGLRDGFDAVEALLAKATEPPPAEQRYRLLKSDDLRKLPSLAWRIRGVLPSTGLASFYGASASGKSFLAMDAAAAIASGEDWFGLRVAQASVVYVALEGEVGLKLRVQAWETHTDRKLPVNLVLQPFKLNELRDVQDLAAAVLSVGSGAVVILDTLNRAAPTADENSSRDMGAILEAAKALQLLTGGLIILVHHTGKDTTKGLRGHSSLFAALDCAVEITRNGDRREWALTKSKDGEDGLRHAFNLRVVGLGVDAEGQPVSSCVVTPDISVAEAKRVNMPQGGNQKIAWEALKPLFKDGTMGKPGAPPYRRCIELEAAITHTTGRLTCAEERRQERAREAITGLVARGVLGCNEGWVWVLH